MIETGYGTVHLVCDACGDSQEFNCFQDAVDHKKDEGWQSIRWGDIWQDVCPECRLKVAPQ